MINIYCSSENGNLERLDEIKKGCWIVLTAPTQAEIERVVKTLDIDIEYITDALDEEEKPRIEKEDSNILMIVDIPVFDPNELESTLYYTLPLGIIVLEDYILTVSLRSNPIIDEFVQKKIKGFFTHMKTRFSLQILYRISEYYLRYLRQINKRTDELERILHKSMKNEELYSLLSLEKSLVYFTTSLRSNEMIMEKIVRGKYIRLYDEDKELIEEVIIENRQAIEMSNIYSSILSGMMDAFASVISNNLNVVMKFLTSFTIILSIPTMVASFFGMNVAVPLQSYNHAFMITILISITLSSLLAWVFARKRFF